MHRQSKKRSQTSAFPPSLAGRSRDINTSPSKSITINARATQIQCSVQLRPPWRWEGSSCTPHFKSPNRISACITEFVTTLNANTEMVSVGDQEADDKFCKDIDCQKFQRLRLLWYWLAVAISLHLKKNSPLYASTNDSFCIKHMSDNNKYTDGILRTWKSTQISAV
jgi:hypothetical protein